MKSLFPLITSMLSGEVEIAIRNAKREAVLLAIIAFFGLIAVSFALVAAFVWLSGIFGALAAALVISGVALAICLVVLITMKIVVARARRRARQRRETAAGYATAATAFLPFVLRSKTALAIGIPLAALAGFLLVPGKSRGNEDED